MNVGLSNFLGDLLEPLADEMKEKAERGSTEAVLSEADMYNKKAERDDTWDLCQEIMMDLLDINLGMSTSIPRSRVSGGPPVAGRSKFQGGNGTEVIVALDAVSLYPLN